VDDHLRGDGGGERADVVARAILSVVIGWVERWWRTFGYVAAFVVVAFLLWASRDNADRIEREAEERHAHDCVLINETRVEVKALVLFVVTADGEVDTGEQAVLDYADEQLPSEDCSLLMG